MAGIPDFGYGSPYYKNNRHYVRVDTVSYLSFLYCNLLTFQFQFQDKLDKLDLVHLVEDVFLYGYITEGDVVIFTRSRTRNCHF